MKINSNSINKMSNEDILNEIIETIDKIYEDFSYVNISKNDYYKLVLEEIEKSKEEYKDNTSYLKYIKDKIIFKIKSIIKDKLSDSNKALDIVSRYITLTFKEVKDEKETIKYLNKLNYFFKSYSFKPDLYLINDLINNNSLLEKMIKIIVCNNYDGIINGKIDDIFPDSNISLMISSYCTLNNISFDSYNEEIDVYSFPDSIRTYLKDISKFPILSYDEQKSLAERVKNGDEKAREKLIECNLRLVVSIAKRYTYSKIPLLDLIEEGNIGLMVASQRYDSNRNCKFSTYATYWIKCYITEAIYNSESTIRTPEYMSIRIIKYKQTIDILKRDLGREPTIEEIANTMNLSVSSIDEISKAIYQTNIVSTNEMIKKEEYEQFKQFIPSTKKSPEDIVIDSSLLPYLYKIFDRCLDEKERNILILNFGLDGSKSLPLSKIAKKYNISTQRVQQIKERAIRKIREKYLEDLVIYTDYSSRELEKINKRLHIK